MMKVVINDGKNSLKVVHNIISLSVIAIMLLFSSGSNASDCSEKITKGEAVTCLQNKINSLEERLPKIKDNILPSFSSIPIGGVIAFWGSLKDIGKLSDFEVCDGTKVTTAKSVLLGHFKPDLRGRFIRGISKESEFNEKKPPVGGSDIINQEISGEVSLTIDQIPAHKHDVADPTHSHNAQNITNAGNIYDSGSNRQAASYFSAPNARTSGEKSGVSIKLNGGGKGHAHIVNGHDNRPSYLELYYIIKVQ